MTTELSIYHQVKDPLQFAMQFGTEIAKSRMFGCDSESQGRVLALACLAERKNPIQIAQTYNIIQGNLSMKADAMLAEFRRLGGKHQIVERTTEAAEVKLTIGEDEYSERLTWQEAQQEPYCYEKDGKALKKNWRTPRARRQMLWARVISEAVHTLRPEIVSGTYTPEEIADFAETSIKSNGEAARQQPVDVEEFIKQQRGQEVAEDGEIIDAEYTATGDGDSTPQQRDQIRELFASLNVTTDQINQVLQKRGVSAIRQLSHEQAAQLIEGLQTKLAGKSRMQEDATSSHDTGPVGQATIDEIKRLLHGNPELVKQIAEHLQKHGKQKIADLSQVDAELLQNCIESNLMESFFDKSLGDVAPF